jgi:hypothetical protein
MTLQGRIFVNYELKNLQDHHVHMKVLTVGVFIYYRFLNLYFIYLLFNEAVNKSDCRASNSRMLMNRK